MLFFLELRKNCETLTLRDFSHLYMTQLVSWHYQVEQKFSSRDFITKVIKMYENLMKGEKY